MDIPTNRGRGPNVPNDVKDIIAAAYAEDPNQTAKEVMEKVHETLRHQGRQLRPSWPGLSYIQGILTDIRREDSKLPLDPLDRPWSLWDVMEYSIPSDALPAVLELWADQLINGQPITIREARWIATLHYVFKDRYTQEDYRKAFNTLLMMARHYAVHEKSAKLLREHPSKPEDMWFRWYVDALFYHPLFGDRKPLDIINSGKLPRATTFKEVRIEEKREVGNERVNKAKK